jgi:transcriptional regulator with XRE-family HTH domain
MAQEVIVAEYWKSGLTQRVFARAAGIGVSTLQLWLRRARSETEHPHRSASSLGKAAAVSLLEVDLAGGPTGSPGEEGHYEVELSHGALLRVPRGFREDDVRRLLRLLKEVR